MNGNIGNGNIGKRKEVDDHDGDGDDDGMELGSEGDVDWETMSSSSSSVQVTKKQKVDDDKGVDELEVPKGYMDFINTPYYLRNFNLTVETVVEMYGHLLEDEHLELVDLFNRMDSMARRLFVRLYQRKGPIFRLENTAYTDIPNVDEALEEMIKYGFATVVSFSDETVDPSSGEEDSEFHLRMNVFRVSELRESRNTMWVFQRIARASLG
eukprot:TRINITY_DN855_c0_g2_i1.p1 TRINITY_DN855_c0_g2~~TRINITY_DN855_c0_g2_i1.p1  ORF type:complete len:211 (-),score=62.07 TRINITY_DN855_c0_g2_i1:173-805(-)